MTVPVVLPFAVRRVRSGASARPKSRTFARPSDVKSMRPWVWKDDLNFIEFYDVVGASGVRLGVPEVYPGLQTKMVDVVPNSAIGAVALQWYTRLSYMAKQNFGIIIGGSVIKQEKFDLLSEHETAEEPWRPAHSRAPRSTVAGSSSRTRDAPPHSSRSRCTGRPSRTPSTATPRICSISERVMGCR